MDAEPSTPAARENESWLPLLRELGVTILVLVAILMTILGVSSVFVFRQLEATRADWARLDMKALETAYKSAMRAKSEAEPNYPADIIPLLEQGENGLIDPWGNQYQVRVFTCVDGYGPQPQFFTFTFWGEEIVWPRQ
jgi:hypothetical protein